MVPENIDMDRQTFEAAFAMDLPVPDVGELSSRFKWARDRASGDGEAAMAAVNEVLVSPLTLDEFIDLIVSAA